jgi:hypothetical protein
MTNTEIAARDEINRIAMESPTPGDYWHEMFCPIFLVLESNEYGVLVQEKMKKVGHDQSEWDYSAGQKAMTHVQFRRICSYSTDVVLNHREGFISDYNEFKQTDNQKYPAKLPTNRAEYEKFLKDSSRDQSKVWMPEDTPSGYYWLKSKHGEQFICMYWDAGVQDWIVQPTGKSFNTQYFELSNRI